MNQLPKYYTTLFHAVEDALSELLLQNYGRARDCLIKGMQDAENAYLDTEETPDQTSE